MENESKLNIVRPFGPAIGSANIPKTLIDKIHKNEIAEAEKDRSDRFREAKKLIDKKLKEEEQIRLKEEEAKKLQELEERKLKAEETRVAQINEVKEAEKIEKENLQKIEERLQDKS